MYKQNKMDILLQADKYLNGNHHLLNIIFSYLGESPSAKVMKELTNDEDMNADIASGLFGGTFPLTYFQMRSFCRGYSGMRMRKYTPFNIPRFKVDVLAIEDDVDCERCNKLLNYPERENYCGYCEKCYGKVFGMGGESDDEPDTETDEDETDEDEDEM